MIRKRVLTAVALAALVVAALALLPIPWLAAFLHLFVLVAAYEWAKLAGVSTQRGWLAYAVAVSAAVVALWLLPAAWPAALAVAAAFWTAALVVVCLYPGSRAVLCSPALVLAAGIVALAGAWLALVSLAMSAGGAMLALWLLVMTTVADSAAYFAGRRFGQRKLAVSVSPGKTWEGVAGGAVATLAWSLAGAWWFTADFAVGAVAWLATGAVLLLAAVTGDLFESALKRSRGVKNSGAILPGHGGVLDRVDSVLAAAPVLALLMAVL